MLIACVAARRISVDAKKEISRFEPATDSVSIKYGNCKPIRAGSSNFLAINEAGLVTISVTLNGKVFCDFQIRAESFDSPVSGYLPLPVDQPVTPDRLLTPRQALLLPSRSLVICLVLGTGPSFKSFALEAQDRSLDDTLLEQQIESKTRPANTAVLRDVLEVCNRALASCRIREVAVQTEEMDELIELRQKLEIAEIHMQRLIEARDSEIFDLTIELSKMRVDAERKLSSAIENRPLN